MPESIVASVYFAVVIASVGGAILWVSMDVRRYPRWRSLDFLLAVSASLAACFAAVEYFRIEAGLANHRQRIARFIAQSNDVRHSGSGDQQFVEGKAKNGAMTWRAKVIRWTEEDTRAIGTTGAVGAAIGLVVAAIRSRVAQARDRYRLARSLCLACGYQLQLDTHVRCPERGMTAEAQLT
ncbi:MAG: hypothetical protein SF069_12165 [Phycisphaerae bacterium]|nr:hypothetical protein [Phycisphaerae bacterium]